MKTLIVHVEFESPPTLDQVQEEISTPLGDLRDRTPERGGAIGWRYFGSLGDAEAWESGEKGIEEVGL